MDEYGSDFADARLCDLPPSNALTAMRFHAARGEPGAVWLWASVAAWGGCAHVAGSPDRRMFVQLHESFLCLGRIPDARRVDEARRRMDAGLPMSRGRWRLHPATARLAAAIGRAPRSAAGRDVALRRIASALAREVAPPVPDAALPDPGEGTLSVRLSIRGDAVGMAWRGGGRSGAVRRREPDLARDVAGLRDAVARRDAAAGAILDRLSALVVAPLAPALRATRRVVFACDGAALSIPLGAVPTDGGPLGRSHAVVLRAADGAAHGIGGAGRRYADASVAVLCDGRAAPGRCRLDGPAGDVRAIRRAMAPAELRAWPDFDAGDLRAAVALRPDVLHVACHMGTAAFDRLARAPAGAPITQRAPRLRLDGIGLVVLAGCDGAPDPALDLLARGAGAVVAASWPVGDAATTAWCGAFYRALGRGDAPAEAVGAAAAEMARTPRWAHPVDWAGFQVYA